VFSSSSDKSGVLLSVELLLEIAQNNLRNMPRKTWSTDLSDRRTFKSKWMRHIAKNRVKQVKKMSLKRTANLKRGRSGASITPKQLAMVFAGAHSVLLGRNPMSLLEFHYFKEKDPSGRPSWRRQTSSFRASGALMGPGAFSAANLFRGEMSLVQHFIFVSR